MTIGGLAAELSASVAQVQRVADELGVHPHLRIDGVPHFSGAASDAIRNRIRRTRAGDFTRPAGDQLTTR